MFCVINISTITPIPDVTHNKNWWILFCMAVFFCHLNFGFCHLWYRFCPDPPIMFLSVWQPFWLINNLNGLKHLTSYMTFSMLNIQSLWNNMDFDWLLIFIVIINWKIKSLLKWSQHYITFLCIVIINFFLLTILKIYIVIVVVTTI